MRLWQITAIVKTNPERAVITLAIFTLTSIAICIFMAIHQNLQSRRPARLHETCGRALVVTDLLVGRAGCELQCLRAQVIGHLTECLPTLRGSFRVRVHYRKVSILCLSLPNLGRLETHQARVIFYVFERNEAKYAPRLSGPRIINRSLFLAWQN